MTKPVHVYVIGRPAGPVKVGVSVNPGSRVLELQTGCPFHLELLASFEFKDRLDAMREEAFFHECYEHVRLTGEWFDLEADLAVEGLEGNIDMRAHFASRAA
jgi:hypothetical protein